MPTRKRPRQRRSPDLPPEVERAQQDGRQRRVYRLGHSWVLSLPHWARRRLECLAGGAVYLHDEGRDEFVLSPVPVRVGGRPSTIKLQQDLAAAKRLIAELQEQRQVNREAIWNEFRQSEVMRQLRIELKGVPAVEAINNRLRRIEDLLGTRRGPWSYRAKRGSGRGASSQPFAGTPVPAVERVLAESR